MTKASHPSPPKKHSSYQVSSTCPYNYHGGHVNGCMGEMMHYQYPLSTRAPHPLPNHAGSIPELVNFIFYRPSWVNILGTKYKIGAVIHVGFDELLPVFALVKAIYVLSSSIKRVYFSTEMLQREVFFRLSYIHCKKSGTS